MKSCASVFLALSLLGAASCTTPEAKAISTPAFRVDGDRITINRDGPIAFAHTAPREGDALPLPPVAGRITTVEAKTSPSFAPLPGRVEEAKVRLGDTVHKGQQLFLVRTPDLSSLEREVRSAELSVATRQASVERTRALVESRAGSEHELALAESELAEARLTSKAARAKLRSLQIARGKDETAYWVLASRSGTVVALDAVPGAQVGLENSSPMAVIADLSEVVAVADVAVHDAAQLKVGNRATIFPFGVAGPTAEGAIEFVSAVVDPERQTVPVRVRLDNSARLLRPNAFVNIQFHAAAAPKALIVPAAAVVLDGANAVVFVVGENGTYLRRQVVVGRRTREHVEIVAGLDAKERVVTSGALLLLNALDVEA